MTWVLLSFVGCGGRELDPQSGTVLEGFGFGWEYFNHRLSYLHVRPGSTSTEVAVVGGTSTTNQVLAPLPATCDVACEEFPFTDSSDVDVSWANLTSTRTAIVRGTVHLEVSAAGATGTVTAPLPEHAPETATALLSGLVLSTQHELSGGPSCYQPEYGWHPRRIAVALGEVTIDGDQVSAPVSATFAAGKTFDPDRECIDAVYDQAVVDLDVDVTFLVGDGAVEDLDLVQGAQFEFSGNPANPEPQTDPAPIALEFPITPTALGFAAIDFAFDPTRTDDRGAYLRTWSFTAAPGEGQEPFVAANATATNFSPGTQLEDFGYRFEGVVRAVDFELELTRGTTSEAGIPAALDEAGQPVITSLDH
ncbi:MAG: hypothetical protein ABMA64_42810 [Myxococcota bacterium]